MARMMTVLFPRGANGDHTPCRTSEGEQLIAVRGQEDGGGEGELGVVLKRLEMRGQDRAALMGGLKDEPSR